MLARLISSSMLAGMVAVDQPHHDAIILILTPPPLVTSVLPCLPKMGRSTTAPAYSPVLLFASHLFAADKADSKQI